MKQILMITVKTRQSFFYFVKNYIRSAGLTKCRHIWPYAFTYLVNQCCLFFLDVIRYLGAVDEELIVCVNAHSERGNYCCWLHFAPTFCVSALRQFIVAFRGRISYILGTWLCYLGSSHTNGSATLGTHATFLMKQLVQRMNAVL